VLLAAVIAAAIAASLLAVIDVAGDPAAAGADYQPSPPLASTRAASATAEDR
jgi:hypothetical protein